MSAPIDPSISSLLRGSSLAPMMDQPVSHILQTLGLPQLPSLPPAPPLPGLPPLPQIDLSAIVRPLTDLASAFGTGQFTGGVHPAVGVAPAPAPSNPPAANNAPAVGHPPATNAAPPAPAQGKPAAPNAPAPAANSPQPAKPGAPAGSTAPGSGTAAHPNPDPTQVLQAISSGLQAILPLGTSALQMLMQLWQGQGSQQAASTGAQATASGGELATQSGTQKAVLGAGAGSVALGGAQMAAVMGKYLTTAAITAPFLAVPGGQAFLLEATVEAIAEALGVTINTRAQMAVHSANMTVAGKKVKVTTAPTGVKTLPENVSSSSSSSGSSLQQLMQLLSPASTLLSTGLQAGQQLATVGQSLSTANAAKPVADNASGALEDSQGGSGGSSFGGGGFGGGGGAVAAMPAAAPLSPWSGNAPAGTTTPAAASTAVAGEPVDSSPLGSSPMMPIGGGAMGATKSTTTASAMGDGGQTNLVTSTNGDAVVGPMEGVTQPVVGALASPQAIEAPPDKELTL